MSQFDEFIENTEFEFRFDAVDHTLICCLDIVKTCVFQCQNRYVESDDEHVDIYEMSHDLSTSLLPSYVAFRSQDSKSLVNVQYSSTFNG